MFLKDMRLDTELLVQGVPVLNSQHHLDSAPQSINSGEAPHLWPFKAHSPIFSKLQFQVLQTTVRSQSPYTLFVQLQTRFEVTY